MPFPRRRLIICLALCTLCLAGWVRSHFHADGVFRRTLLDRTGVSLLPGGLTFFHVRLLDRHPDANIFPAEYLFRGPQLSHLVRPSDEFDARFLGFGYIRSPGPLIFSGDDLPTVTRYRRYRATPSPGGGETFTPLPNDAPPDPMERLGATGARGSVIAARLPFWFLTLLSLTPLLPPMIRRLRPRDPHACPACGYDLRATPDRCPECGRIPAQTM